ncbi:MAG: FAD-binding protein [Lachnospiraceae bacterium]|nr:FAD-binding protein [Lachnospiraceae bacterium]
MNQTLPICGYLVPIHSYQTLILGSGAAGFAAAERLFMAGHKDIALITEHVQAGTSRNTGSDKQTYYKLSLSGFQPDSIREMAYTLMDGGCVDGDLALCEAALSARCFLHLVDLGVPFPSNRYGEYVGYKTDHDPRSRATSAGPYTSKMMTEALEQVVLQNHTPIYDHMQAIRLLVHNEKLLGVLCLDLTKSQQKAQPSFAIFLCANLICATGGPAGIYYDSVYPHGHFGSSGIALEAGAAGKNLTEWQYGLASLHPRWNISGTYMQSLPRFFSTAADGSDERDFLRDFFEDPNDLLFKTFLKGYQWPFDARKAQDGSSIVDILVFQETKKGRRVFLDYRQNPVDPIDYEKLPPEAGDFLRRAGACLNTPYERLAQMNQPAVDFFLDKGVDLKTTPLEIALCAQHCNGGLGVDCWWQTRIQGLFSIGELSGTHGVYRPGGTALNAGQAGALRAAQYIAAQPLQTIPTGKEIIKQVGLQIKEMILLADKVLSPLPENVTDLIDSAQKRMSCCAAAFRSLEPMRDTLQYTKDTLFSLPDICHVKTPGHLKWLYRLRDILICQQAVLTAMIDYVEKGGKSRGSALYQDPGGLKPAPTLCDEFTFRLEETPLHQIQEILYKPCGPLTYWRDPRPLPEEDDFFENVWRRYRTDQNIY